MFRHNVRRFATTTARRVAPAIAHEPSAYTLAVSRAQGIAKGLTGGTFLCQLFYVLSFPLSFPITLCVADKMYPYIHITAIYLIINITK